MNIISSQEDYAGNNSDRCQDSCMKCRIRPACFGIPVDMCIILYTRVDIMLRNEPPRLWFENTVELTSW